MVHETTPNHNLGEKKPNFLRLLHIVYYTIFKLSYPFKDRFE